MSKMKYLKILYFAFLPSMVLAAESLISVTAPDQVYPGSVVPVTVTYTASQNRDILIFFQLNSSPWTSYGGKQVTVPAGTAQTVDVDVPISEATPIAANAYKFGVNLVPVGGGWPDRIDEKNIPNVDCVEPPPSTNSVETISVMGPPVIVPGSTVPGHLTKMGTRMPPS